MEHVYFLLPGDTEPKAICLYMRGVEAHSEIQPQLNVNARDLIFGSLPAFLFADVRGFLARFFSVIRKEFLKNKEPESPLCKI